jgi:hypothetical protein
MQKRMGLAGILCGILGASAAAQTAVTTSGGTTNTVPLFTGSATLGNSNITQSGSNVGIGTTNPGSPLEVQTTTSGAWTGVIGLLAPNNTTAGNASVLRLGTSLTPGNTAELRFIYQGNNSAANRIDLGFTGYALPGISYSVGGNVGIGTVSPAYALDVSGNIHSSSGVVYPDGTTQTTAYTAGASGYLHLFGNTNPTTTQQGTYLGWNAFTGGMGETDFINNPGTGSGGFAFMGVPPSGSPMTTQMFINGSGNVGIGTTTPNARLEVSGTVQLTSGSGAKMIFQDGSVQSVAWNGVLSGGDYAESVDVIGDRKAYEPGDVLVIDPTSEGKFLKSSQPYSTNVLGVYSTKPGVVGRRQTSDRSHMAEEVPMAMVGVIPTKVCAEGGPIKPGDLLVTSSTPGYAMKGTDRTQMLGAIIGKALGHLDTGTGVMEVGVSIQ